MISWIITIGVVCMITSVIFYKPYLGIAFVILSIPFEGIIEFGCISIYPLEAILAILCLICIYKLIVGMDNCFRNTKLVYCCIPFVLCIMLSAMKSIEFSLTVKEIVRWLELFVIYYITINLINDEKKLRIILYFIFFTVAVVSILGIIDHLRMEHRAISLFGNSNPLAGYVNLIIPVLFGMMMTKVSLWEKRTLFIITILSAMIWCLTFSKVAWISLVLTMVFLFFQTKSKKRGTFFLAIFFAILAIAFLIPDLRDDLVDKVSLDKLHYTFKYRSTCYAVGYDMLKDDSILGIGIGNYPPLIKKFVYSDPLLIKRFVKSDPSMMQTHLHSLYLQTLVETGFMGLSAFVFWIVCIIKHLVSSLKSLENTRHYWLFVGLMGGVIVYLFNNLTDVLVVHGIHLQWGIILGLAVVLTQLRESETCPTAV
jgi:putative inorganic carbon (hco3(-)) transporter